MSNIPDLNCEAVFNRMGLSAVEISRKDVGASYEPRLQLDYEIRDSQGDLINYYRRLIMSRMLLLFLLFLSIQKSQTNTQGFFDF